MIEVEGPGGTVVEFPDGTDQSTIKRAMAKKFGAPVDFSKSDQEIRSQIQRAAPTDRNKLYRQWAKRSIANERAKGFTPLPDPARGIPILGGLVDEGAALVNSGLHTITGGNVGRPYDEGLAFQRERHRQSEAANPALATTSQLAAGLVTGGPVFGRMAPAATSLGRVAQGAGIGAGIGAVEGFTRGEGSFRSRAGNAAENAVFGGGVGAALPVAGDLVARGVGAARKYIGPTMTRMREGADEAADQILANRIHGAGTTPGQIRLDLQRGQTRAATLQGGGSGASRAQLPEAIADTSDSLRRLTGSLYRTGGEAGNFIEQTLNNRQRGLQGLFERVTRQGTDGQHQRIMNATERALLIRTSNTARQTEREIVSKMRADGNRLYEAAYQQSEPFDIQGVLDGLSLKAMQYPGQFRSRLLRALSLFRDESPTRFPVSNVARFDAAKKALDDMIDTAQRQGQNNLSRELATFKTALLEQVHANGKNAAYRAARDAWGSAAERREAIDLGRASLRENSEVSAEQFRELTTGQQQLFRVGFLESLRNAIGSKGRGHDITRIFDQNRVRQLMSEIIPRSRGKNSVFSNRPERFGNLIDRESRMVDTRAAAFGNSMTQRNQADDAAFAGDALATMWNRFRSSPSLFNMGIEAIGAGIQRVFGYNQKVALALAKRLLETDPTTRNQILRRLQRRTPQGFARFTQALDRSVNTLIPATAPHLTIEGER